MWESNRETRNHSFSYQKVFQMCLIQHPKHCKWDGAKTLSLPPAPVHPPPPGWQ